MREKGSEKQCEVEGHLWVGRRAAVQNALELCVLQNGAPIGGPRLAGAGVGFVARLGLPVDQALWGSQTCGLACPLQGCQGDMECSRWNSSEAEEGEVVCACRIASFSLSDESEESELRQTAARDEQGE